MSITEQQVLQELRDREDISNPSLRMLKRKLAVREAQRNRGLSVFNLDDTIKTILANQKKRTRRLSLLYPPKELYKYVKDVNRKIAKKAKRKNVRRYFDRTTGENYYERSSSSEDVAPMDDSREGYVSAEDSNHKYYSRDLATPGSEEKSSLFSPKQKSAHNGMYYRSVYNRYKKNKNV